MIGLRKNEVEIVTEYGERIVFRPRTVIGTIAFFSERQCRRIGRLTGNYTCWNQHGVECTIEIAPEDAIRTRTVGQWAREDRRIREEG